MLLFSKRETNPFTKDGVHSDPAKNARFVYTHRGKCSNNRMHKYTWWKYIDYTCRWAEIGNKPSLFINTWQFILKETIKKYTSKPELHKCLWLVKCAVIFFCSSFYELVLKCMYFRSPIHQFYDVFFITQMSLEHPPIFYYSLARHF